MFNGIVWAIYFMIAIPVVAIGIPIGLYWMHRSTKYVNARIAGEQQQKRKTQAVLERRTETERVAQTEKVMIELVPNEELSLGLTNLTGSINHHAQVIETTAKVMPLSQVVPLEIQEEAQENESVRESVNTPYSIRQSPSLEEIKNGEVDDAICAQRKHGKTVQMIADDYGVSKSAIEKRITVLKRDGLL